MNVVIACELVKFRAVQVDMTVINITILQWRLVIINFVSAFIYLQVKLTQGNLTFMPTQDSVASQQELIVASRFLCMLIQRQLAVAS